MTTQEQIEEILNEIYEEFENDIPPKSILDKYENEYNEGFYRGQLKAMETVVQRLTGKTGDEIKPFNLLKND